MKMNNIPNKNILIELNNKGYSYKKIADMLGVLETNTIMYYFKKYGIEKNHARTKEKYNYPKKGRINL